ncbi:bifunctional glutamate N-acetyltransferase/amino-acid acetyltransferase ArgJ [Kushneria phosphatilytica]|uniref:Arginine biosynthesis bifunctional protein ArgJ n=1 Tax=Kushneria phosphatilytica TaxID=657387 RepID=A0A1S1NSJ2_9GAMM|nr:bifunctional glutamate N-acetyltransferase/amino-acid acetyltransferase ArgJ [Kushneria phosphatilytica]OHV12219.1 bifunctional ornithine acetyltransferase/N-acetylglutamate synthase [Kushneria phosphatilytica]QEL11415.1 bifunctional glutamate N-acetyltransferase/amino-acid acetyltransferase ArgJ [Kushneria phosphatilytica]
MATGEARFPEMPEIAGIRLGTAMAGIKRPGQRDLVVIEICEGAHAAATFTRNAFRAAPVRVAQQHLTVATPRYLLINTGNANAGNGEAGIAAARDCCAALAERVEVLPESVLPYSTGVIGEPLPVERIRGGLDGALSALNASGWSAAAEGILTTDTRPKGATTQVALSSGTVTLNGIAKGAGMIRPNMATMLAFLATDAAIEPVRLQQLLREGVEHSFNRITIDSDTSTNDACTLVATGCGSALLNEEDIAAFRDALIKVLQTLAHAIVRDGEGATKFVTIDVEQARSEEEALEVAFSVAHSPLVKTALYASDANWGRLLMAVGKAPVEQLDVERIGIDLNGVTIAEKGGRAADYTEEAGATEMAKEDIVITIRLGRGNQKARVWTSDLSHDYVSINADYRS